MREEIATAAEAGARWRSWPRSSTCRVDELGVLAEAGLGLLGENRAQDLIAKAEAYPARFTWDFIGQLQSRKVSQLLPYVRYIHSVASDSALAQLGRHGTAETRILVEVNVAGEAGKSGIAPDELPGFLERCPVPVVGLMTMPPLAARAGGQPAPLRCAARARRTARAGRALDGNEPGLPGRRAGGRHHRAARHGALQSAKKRLVAAKSVIIPAGKPRQIREP